MGKITPKDHAADLYKIEINDPAEILFGALAGQLQSFGQIGLINAAGVSQVRTNEGFKRGFETSSSNKKNKTKNIGFFHTLPENPRTSLIIMVLEHSPQIRNADLLLLSKQRDVKMQKENIAQEQGLENTTEQYIDALYYYDKYGSPACWMKVSDVDRELKKLKS